MPPTPRPYRPDDGAAFHALLRDPSLAAEFGWLQENHELDDPTHHPFAGPAGAWVADEAGELAGFSTAVRFASPRGDWALLRVGVHERYRRRGLGRALLEAARVSLLGRGEPAEFELKISYWDPNPNGEAFTRAMGFMHDRYFWNMDRPSRVPPTVVWPVGIEPRAFDSSPRAFQDWNDCSNAAFANNAMSAMSTVEQCRMLSQQSHFRPAGLLLAYRDGRCVGFCRCALHPELGDLDVLGVVPEARGIGLGRGLVRWGTTWLLEQNAPNVRLTVDGENTRALELYRSEGFEIVKTRRIWKTTLGGRR